NLLTESEKNKDPARAAATSAIQEIRTLKDNAIAKRRAAASGQDVRVAPQLRDPTPRPMIAAPSTDDGHTSGPGGGGPARRRRDRGRTQQVAQHQAPQGRGRQEARPAVEQVLAGDPRRGQAGRRRSRQQPDPSLRDR